MNAVFIKIDFIMIFVYVSLGGIIYNFVWDKKIKLYFTREC